MALPAYVLIADDDPMILELLGSTLEAAGYRVTTASDSWQEVIQAQGLKIGLIISDIQMPGLGSGVDAVKKLRACPSMPPRLPVIFMTGMSLERARAMIPPDPCIRLVGKPLDFDQLRAAIKELTGIDRPL
ncbi:MAG: response regulator [Elusimicrobia bacterium]|nr:response regulator [Elusimicrobiota bacterium]